MDLPAPSEWSDGVVQSERLCASSFTMDAPLVPFRLRNDGFELFMPAGQHPPAYPFGLFGAKSVRAVLLARSCRSPHGPMTGPHCPTKLETSNEGHTSKRCACSVPGLTGTGKHI